jgi:hypothetical protein
MERRGSNTWLVAALALAVGFLAALLIFGRNDSKNAGATVSNGTTVATTAPTATATTPAAAPGPTATTTSTSQATTAPQSPPATTDSCIALWNQPTNRGPQTFLVNLASREPIRVHVGATTSVPPKCLVTVVANNGDAYTFPEGGGTTYPYAPAAGQTSSSSLPAAQKTSNALDQRDGTLTAR